MANHKQRAAALLVAGLFVVITLASPAVQAQSFNVLFDFSGSNGQDPLYLSVDAAGNFYGTTYLGGTHGFGAVYKLSRHGSGWSMAPLYNFSGQEDGADPWSGVVTGRDGSLYGTTEFGGRNGAGVVYKLQPPPAACKTAICYWTETVLYNFSGYSDGSGPQGHLVFDQAGNLYGTTVYGGGADLGTLWELTPSQGLTVIHTFTGGPDGAEPVGGVIFDQGGSLLYGVTTLGGTSNLGVAYELSPAGSGWTETFLHTFAGGSDGAHPSGLISDSEGNLYGFTGQGGGPNYGTAYELQPVAGGFSYSILYVFQPHLGGEPGLANLPTLQGGNLYGAASAGGTNNDGAIFELTPAAGGWNFTPLHDFAGSDGNQPAGSPVFDAAGNLYGVTLSGGTSNFGVIWQIMP
jgi:uncharacterized repeat protein (TIGR03803 family)